MGKGEGTFEFVFVVRGLAFPELAIIREEASFKDELVSDGSSLSRHNGQWVAAAELTASSI
jgi:hypothetical protein